MAKIEIYDCGCVKTRPKEQSCKSYGTRWRAYLTIKFVKLKCRDCGRLHSFQLQREGVQTIQWMELKDEEDDEDEMVKE